MLCEMCDIDSTSLHKSDPNWMRQVLSLTDENSFVLDSVVSSVLSAV